MAPMWLLLLAIAPIVLCRGHRTVLSAERAAVQHRSAQPELLLPVSGELPCQQHNSRLNAWLRRGLEESGQHLIPSAATDLDTFILEVKAALDAHQLPARPINYLFSGQADFHPTCAGEWLEFGVASGGTINLAAQSRRGNCSPNCPAVFGFDTFTGLPEKWIRDDAHTWKEHDFDQGGNQGKYPKVEENVHLIKGLFNESIPPFLENSAIYAGKDITISYLHVDCDLYAGARDIFKYLGSRIRVGTVIIFDELINYQYFADHEMKAFWEWVSESGARLLPIGVLGPLPGRDFAVEIDPNKWIGDAGSWEAQSAAFVVAYMPRHHQKH